MKKWLSWLGVFACSCVQAAPLTFSATGCGPYLPKDEEALRFYLKQENGEKNRSKFIVHLGDLISGIVGRLLTEPAAFESLFDHRKELLTKDNKIPTLVLLGDNEWNDTPAPAVAYKSWSTRFLGMEKAFEGAPQLTMDTKVPSNFYFEMDGVLFVGILLTGGRLHDANEWNLRLPANAAWIASAMATEAGKRSRATVILTQANPMIRPKGEPDRFENFLVPMRAAVATYGKPVLFLHADGHKWTDDYPWPEKNLRRVQLDLLNTKYPPTQITVADTGDAAAIFSFERRLNRPEWLFLKDPPQAETKP